MDMELAMGMDICEVYTAFMEYLEGLYKYYESFHPNFELFIKLVTALYG